MKRLFQIYFTSVTLCSISHCAEPIGTVPPALPRPPLTVSPVQTFRMLLATNEIGRAQWLARKNPEQRQHLANKIQEYEAMPAAEREERLQALQLRWYLPLLMKMKAADRAQQLARIPLP